MPLPALEAISPINDAADVGVSCFEFLESWTAVDLLTDHISPIGREPPANHD